ncbi:MAG: hypothetical protein C0594_11675 [Marinilabiliales bacterium]|nr:MAG: hypothetical protein C0594_11675 [Marinilabiliales bacterium]
MNTANRNICILLFIGLFFNLLPDARSQVKESVIVYLEEINTSHDEFSPQFIDEKTIVFSSNRRNKKGESIVEYAYSNYEVKIDKDSISGIQKMSYLLNSDNHDICTGTSKDMKTVYIYKSFNGGDIYSSEKKGNDKWKGPKKLSVNTEAHESSASSINDILYFTSNKPGGKGMHDIYASKKLSDGKYEKPTPLEILNTDKDENYVFISNDGKTLFFSSNRNGGFGKYDIYKSVLTEDGSWGKPVKLPEPINSKYNDVCYIISPGNIPYFCSDRSDTGQVKYNIYKMKPMVPVKKEIIDTIPIFLKNKSDIEKNKLGKIVQTKDYIIVKAFKEYIPDKLVVNKEEIKDSTDIIYVKDILLVHNNIKAISLPTDPIFDIVYSIPEEKKDTVSKIEVNQEYTLDELSDAIDFKIQICKIQVGAFNQISSLEEFENTFPLLKGKVVMEKHDMFNTFFMKETFHDLQNAAKLQEPKGFGVTQ